MCMGILSALCLYNTCELGAFSNQKMKLDPLGLKLGYAVEWGAEN